VLIFSLSVISSVSVIQASSTAQEASQTEMTEEDLKKKTVVGDRLNLLRFP